MASVRAGRLTARVILVLVAALTAAWAMVMPAERAVAQAAWRVLGEGAADPPAFRMPIALSVDGSGSVYVVDQVYGFVMRVTSAGEYGGAWGRALNVQEIVKPRAVAVSVDGNVFVADHDARAVLQLSPDGTLLSSWEAGTASSLAFDHEGNLYVGYAGRSAELLT